MYYDTKKKKQKIMKTIAQQLNVKDFPFIIRDENNNEVYFENSDAFWYKREYDEDGNEVYQPKEVCENVLINLQDYDFIYQAIVDAIDTELGECL